MLSSSLIKTGNFIGLENLEELDMSSCSNLEELDISVGCLQKLVKLDLNGCKRLKRLPWESMCTLRFLKDLDLGDCSNITEISHEVGSLIGLKRLVLYNNNRLSSLPNSLCQLHQLTQIDLSRCTNLKSIPDLPPSIEELHVSRCTNLVNLPSNCNELQFITELVLTDCLTLGSEGFTQVTGLRNLQKLYMRNCNVSRVSSGIGNFVSLTHLDLSENTFSSLPETFSNLSQLKHLLINGCSQLKWLPLLPSQLKYIDAENCVSLEVFPFDSMQNAYVFPSIVFKKSRLMSNEGLLITLSKEEVPEWCTYGNGGDELFFVAPNQVDTKICGIILCSTRRNMDNSPDMQWGTPTIYNETKGTYHTFSPDVEGGGTMKVMFYPLNDTILVMKAGDTVEVRFLYGRGSNFSCGWRLVYEDDVIDSGLTLKDVWKLGKPHSLYSQHQRCLLVSFS